MCALRLQLVASILGACLAGSVLTASRSDAATGCTSATEASLIMEASRAAGRDAAALDSVREVVELGNQVIAEGQLVAARLASSEGSVRDNFAQLRSINRALESQSDFINAVLLRSKTAEKADLDAAVFSYLKFLESAASIQIVEGGRESYVAHHNYWYSTMRRAGHIFEADTPSLNKELRPFSSVHEGSTSMRPAIERLATHMARSEQWARGVNVALSETRMALEVSSIPERSGRNPVKLAEARQKLASALEIVDRYAATRDAAEAGTGTDAFYISPYYRNFMGRLMEGTVKLITRAEHLPPEVRTEFTTAISTSLTRLRSAEADARDGRLEWE